jgi:hypothetical protein
MLSLGNNNLDGNDLFQILKYLPHLQGLNIRSNYFSGNITDICQLRHLKFFFAQRNQFTGVIPDCILTMGLHDLRIFGNKFTSYPNGFTNAFPLALHQLF